MAAALNSAAADADKISGNVQLAVLSVVHYTLYYCVLILSLRHAHYSVGSGCLV